MAGLCGLGKAGAHALCARRRTDPSRQLSVVPAGGRYGTVQDRSKEGFSMRMILLASAALALSACGGGGSEGNDANALAGDNMMMDQNMMMDGNMMMDPNMSANGMTGMDANGAMDANAQNMMAQDAATNDPDTNLANGI